MITVHTITSREGHSEHVDEADEHGHGDLACFGFGGDAVDLVLVVVHQRDPDAVVIGVAEEDLVERPRRTLLA